MAKRSRSDPAESRGDLELEEMRSRLDQLGSKLHAAKTAYLSRTTLDGEEMTYDGLVAVANQYVQASYALQKRRFGAIKVRLSIAKLLR